MRHKWILISVLLWFFGTRTGDPDNPGVFISSVRGPFQTRGACEKYRADVKGAFEILGIEGVVYTECKEMSGQEVKQ